MLSLFILIGLCLWIYYCNQQAQKFLARGAVQSMLIWSYTAMLSAVIIVACLIYSLSEQLLRWLDVFYRH